jgi:DNA-binding CsgD family transcriptional regulator
MARHAHVTQMSRGEDVMGTASTRPAGRMGGINKHEPLMSTSLRVLQHSAPASPAAADTPHPWLRALDVFGVPYLCYSHRRAGGRMSPAAAALLESAAGSLIVEQADRLVAAELTTTSAQLHIGQFVRTRTVRTHEGLSLNVFVAWPSLPDVDAIVVLGPETPAARSDDQPGGLTRREAEVARLVGAGFATKEIAQRLGISGHTTRHHIERVFAKLGVRSRASLAALMGGRSGPSLRSTAMMCAREAGFRE